MPSHPHVFMSRLPRRVAALTATAVAASFVVAGCTDADDSAETGSSTATSTSSERGSDLPSTASSAPSSSAAPAATTPPAYAAGAGAFTPAVAAKLGRSSVPDQEMTGPGATVGSWKGTQVGVLATGADATLVVRQGTAWQVVGGWWPSKGLPGPYLGGKRHVLLIGSDARPGQRIDRSRADALQLFGMDGRGGGGVLGIPRDTWTPLSTGGTNKINAAMAKGGPGAEVATVSRMTGIPVKGYLLTGFQGFSATVNAMGGVEITLPRKVRHLPAGTQRLTGPDLLWVARERKTLPGGDLDRSSNQGLVLLSVLTQMRKSGIGQLPTLMSKTSQHFTTDLAPAEVLTLMAQGYALNPSRVGRQVVPSAPGTAPGGASVVLLKPAAKATFTKFVDGNL